MMKHFFYFVTLACGSLLSNTAATQDLNFRDSVYYYYDPQTDLLSSAGMTLGAFNFSTADHATDSLFQGGIYFPSNDCFGNNLWIRVRHVAEDPNGNFVGVDVPATVSNPCTGPTILGGWAGFLYDIEIYADNNLNGARAYQLDELFPTSITVSSLEWLGGPCNYNEWLSFTILNEESTGWNLNSINFTGVNPQSNPVFSDTLAVYASGGCYPPDGFSYTFPTGADSVSATSGSQTGSGLSEFRMSAGNVSHFQYGYEYTGLSGGYQGMGMAFGAAPTFTSSAVNIECLNGNDGQIIVTVDGGIGPFTYSWNNGITTGNSLTDLLPGTYYLTVIDQNGCGTLSDTLTITEPANVSVATAVEITNVSCYNGSDGGIILYAGGIAPVTYEWNTGDTVHAVSGLPAGTYTTTITDANSCLVVINTITQPDAIDVSTSQSGYTITANETDATYQWINCDGNVIIADSTSASYTPWVTGSYQVAITSNGCTDNSACVDVIITGINEVNERVLAVFPNPSHDMVNIMLAGQVINGSIKVLNMVGDTVIERTGVTGTMFNVDVRSLANGMYILELSVNGSASRRRITKN